MKTKTEIQDALPDYYVIEASHCVGDCNSADEDDYDYDEDNDNGKCCHAKLDNEKYVKIKLHNSGTEWDDLATISWLQRNACWMKATKFTREKVGRTLRKRLKNK